MTEFRKRKIAVLMSGINEAYQHDILSGIIHVAKEIKYDVYVFTSFAEGVHQHTHDIGEMSVFDLPDFSCFDGIVLLSNTIKLHKSTETIFKRISELKIPIVDIDNELDNAYCISIDNERAMRDVVEHFVLHHGFKRINFVSGPLENPEARARLRAYREVLADNDIPVEEERIFYGNFVRERGKEAVEFYLNSELPFPEAIICANDNMALSVHAALISRGFRVPEDVAISGFDNIEEASSLIPQLTTVSRPLYEVGVLACQIIYDSINGKSIPKNHSLESHAIFTETCGCPRRNTNDFMQTLYAEYAKIEILSDFITNTNKLSQSLNETNSKNIVEALAPHIAELDCEAYYLCLNKGWCSEDLDVDEQHDEPIENEEKYVEVAVACENKIIVDYADFPRKNIVPCFDRPSTESILYVVTPLHFGERCFGYAVNCNGDFLRNSIMYHSWLMNIASYLENFRKQSVLTQMVNTLDSLYIRDQLTGLYNRRGFFRFSQKLFEQNPKSSVIFYDIDDFKLINDTYGHDGGDLALKRFASVLMSYSNAEVIPSRFGGDEFVVFCAGYGEVEAATLCATINAKVQKTNTTSNEPFKIFTSSGIYTSSSSAKLTLNDCIEYADGRMYKEKYMKKKESSPH